MSNGDFAFDERAVMRRLLALIMAAPAEHPDEKWGRSSAFLSAAASTYFLLDPQPRSGVKRFVTRTLERLVQQLSRSTQQRQMEYRGQVRGRIAWPATFKARYGQDYDPTRFVCREVRHQYDTLENQLLRYVVARIHDCIRSVPKALRNGACCYGPGTGDLNPRSTASELADIETVLGRLRRNVRLWEVPLPDQINELHLLRAKTSRVEEYTEVARVYEHYRAIVETYSWEALADASKRVLLLPPDAGPAGEPWIQLGADMLRGQSLVRREPVAAPACRARPVPAARRPLLDRQRHQGG